MNNIIQEICQNFMENVLEVFNGKRIKKIDEMEEGLSRISHEFVLEIMQEYIEELDNIIIEFIYN